MAQTKSKTKSASGTSGNSKAKKSNTKNSSTTKKNTSAASQKRSSGSKAASGRQNSSPARVTKAPAKTVDTVQPPVEKKEEATYQELVWIVLALLCIILFIGDLNLMGSFGHALKTLQFGLFGTIAYIFPFFFFLLLAVIYAGGAESGLIPFSKVFEGIILFLCICGLFGMMGGQGDLAGQSLEEFYMAGTEGLNGGVLGGILCVNLVSWAGKFGACLILLLVMSLCLLLIPGRSVLNYLYYRRKKIRRRARAMRERALEEERLRREEEELAEQEEEMLRRENAWKMRQRQENIEARRTELHARSLAFGEATRLEPEGEMGESQTEVTPDSNPAAPANAAENDKKPARRRKKSNRDVLSYNMKELDPEQEQKPEDVKAENAGSAEAPSSMQDETIAFTGTIHGAHVAPVPEAPVTGSEEDSYSAEPVQPYQPIRTRHTREELEAMDPKVDLYENPTADAGDSATSEPELLEDASNIGDTETTGFAPVNPEEEEFISEDIERTPIYDDDPYMDTSGWLDVSDETGEIRIARDQYDPAKSSGLHPAAEEFSTEESMSGYDDFDDAPLPEEVLRQGGSKVSLPKKGAAASTTAKSSAASDSIWRSGDKQEGNSGARFSDLNAVPAEAPVIKKEYQFPMMELLQEPSRKGGMSEDQLKATAIKLQQTLRNFGVGVTVTDISCGPAVTRYELQPDQGVKVSRIVGLADDIKLNLAAADIRIEAPIPGKAAVGIEVPNEKKQMVTLKELLDSEEFRRNASKVSFGVGKDIAGKVIVADLARMPHLLIAGATGSGKSVCINSIIVSILYKAHPDDVKLIMIDPKVVELSVYNGIPHLMIPVVTDPKKAAAALNWAVVEMNDRYRRFAETGCRDIKSFNRKVENSEEPGMEKMPQIIVIVDELADLMMVAASEVEESICRLAQLARAAGIHLVLATQRPSVDVITGLIKANVPSRIAFSVSSTTDSRTIIDMGGAEKLLGNGDMMFYPAGYPKPVRVQGAFVSDDEVSAVVEALTSQQYGRPGAGQHIEKQLDQMKDAGTVGAGARDELFEKAGRYIIEKEKASIGNLQRMFRIGFNRAARIMDQLADYGVVGPEEGTKARQILMNMDQFEELLKEL